MVQVNVWLQVLYNWQKYSFVVITMAVLLFKKIKYQSHNALNIRSVKMANPIFETYKQSVMSHDFHSYQTAYDMAMAIMCAYPPSQHTLSHWKYVHVLWSLVYVACLIVRWWVLSNPDSNFRQRLFHSSNQGACSHSLLPTTKLHANDKIRIIQIQIKQTTSEGHKIRAPIHQSVVLSVTLLVTRGT